MGGCEANAYHRPDVSIPVSALDLAISGLARDGRGATFGGASPGAPDWTNKDLDRSAKRPGLRKDSLTIIGMCVRLGSL